MPGAPGLGAAVIFVLDAVSLLSAAAARLFAAIAVALAGTLSSTFATVAMLFSATAARSLGPEFVTSLIAALVADFNLGGTIFVVGEVHIRAETGWVFPMSAMPVCSIAS